MLSNKLVELSPTPPLSCKRQMETSSSQQQQQQSSSLVNSFTYEQESSFKRSRPLLSQALISHDDYRHVRQQPRTLEIFKPLNTIAKGQEKETTITRSYEYEKRRSASENSRQQRNNQLEIGREYLRCLDDLTVEYEKLQQQQQQQQKRNLDNQKKKTTTYETKENYESIEEVHRRSRQPIRIENTYQRSLSEGLLHQRLKPITTTDITLSEEDVCSMEYRLQPKERLRPIRIHSSSSSIPGETSIKYVRTERIPVEVLVPKPQITTTQGEHSSTIIKDNRHLNRKITTNIQQQQRRRTIEGQHELRIIEQPITSEQTRPVEFTVSKPISVEHSSTYLINSTKGSRFQTMDISETLMRQRTLSGEHDLRVISQPIQSSLQNQSVEFLFPKPTFSSSSSSHHSSTIVKQNRTPKSSLFLDNVQTKLKGQHELRIIDQPIGSGPGNSVELIVPKSVTDTPEHTTTMITETQPHRRVLEISGSGKKLESEHERKYFHDTVRVEEEIEIKLPKQKREQIEHSTTIVKHSRGKRPIIEIDTSQRTMQGEHETRIFEESIETKADTMELLIAKPQMSTEHSTTIIKRQHGKPQRFTIDHTQPIPGEHQTKIYEQPVESFSEMEVVFTKQQPQQTFEDKHTSTLIKKVHSKEIIYDKHPHEIPGEHQLTFFNRSTQQQEKEIEFIVPKSPKKRLVDHYQSSNDYSEKFFSSTYEEEEEETSGEHTTTYLKQTRAKYAPIELVVDRPRQLPSISKLIADIPADTEITSIKPTKIIFPEDSSVKLDLQLSHENLFEKFDEMEIVLEKPRVQDSSTVLLANIQPGLELKSIQPTQQIQQTIEENTSTFTIQREQQSKEDLVELRIRKPHIQDSSTVLLANVQPELGVQGQLKPSPYITQTIEESSSALTMNLNTNQETVPFELIIPRIDIESSTSTILAQIAPTIAGIRTKIDVPEVEKSTSSFVLEQKKRINDQIELVIPKPKRLETSSSTMIADVEAKLETKNIRPSEIQPESSTSTFYFEETSEYVLPQPVEIRMKQPIIGDSSTTLLANVKATLDTQTIQRLGQTYQPVQQSTSEILFETKTNNIQPSEVELILPRPRIQESTSVILADIRPTLDTSQTHVVIPPPFQSPIKSSSEIIFEEEKFETTPVELHVHRQPSSHTVLANIDDVQIKHRETYILGTNYQQQQQQPYDSSTIHADLNKPLELIFNIDEGKNSSISQQYRRDYNTTTGTDSSSTLLTDIQPRQYQPIEFVVSGGLTGYDTNVDQYSTGTGGYTTTTTTTKTTKRKLTSSSDTGDTNRSIIRGIRPYDQVDLVLQPDSSLSSSSKVLTTSIGLDHNHSPYFSLTLHDQTVRESESVLFEVIVSAQPSAEIIWDKDGQLIGDDSAFRIDYYGDGRTTLYIPEAFLDDQGYYTCTATNTLGTCRTTARLTVDSTGEGISPKRRQLNTSQTVYYQEGPKQTIETYRIYSKPTTVTQITEETQIYQIPSHQQQQQQQQSEITYSIEGSQPQYAPVSFLVSTTQENAQPAIKTTFTTNEEEQSMVINPYQIFGTQLQTRPNQNVIPSYGDDSRTTTTTTTTRYSQQQQQQQQQQPRNTSLLATVAKQPGPSTYNYQQSLYQKSDSMHTESDASTIHLIRSTQQPQEETISYITSRPNFTKPLEPIDALEGGTVQITVHLTSAGPNQARPQIQWYHHAQPIISDEQHYRITEGYDTSTLEIINVRKADTGQVWCVATTPAGSATTTCTINVEERPIRTTHRTITSQQQFVPQETTYTTESIRSTHAQIPLYQQQQPEQQVPTNYYTTQTIDQQSHIIPQETIYKTQSIHSTHTQIPLHHQQPEQRLLSQYYNTPQSYQPEQTSFTSFSTQQQQPKSQAPFQPYTSQEQPQQISPQSFTSFSTQQQQQQPKVQASFQPYTSQEQPQQTSPQSFIPQAPPLLPNFNIQPNYSDQQVKIINNGLQDQPLYSGQETVFEIQFTGQPNKVQWFRNDVEIINHPQQINSRIYHVTNTTNGTSRLIFKTTLDEDVGTYTVKLTGPTGEEINSAKLIPASQFQNIQKKKADQTQRKALLQELEEKQSQRIRQPKQLLPRSSLTSYGTSDDDVFLESTQRTAPQRHPTAPTVSRPFKDLDIKETQPIQLTCQVQGFPKSELLWFKNNLPLPLSARHKITYDAGSGTITLRVNDSRPEDSGVYTLIAKNPQGYVETSARIDVQETPAIDETSYVQPDAFKYIEKQPLTSRPTKGRRESDTPNLQQKPAKILKTPMSTSVVEGGTATFTCQVEGSPKPKIAWLKDNKPLMSGPRFQTYFDQPSKTAVLRIADVSKDDQGYYTCIVDNTFNSDQSTATLQVIPESKVDQRSYVEIDAFKYLTPENKQARTANKDIDRPTSGVDSESFVNLDSFRYLEAKKPTKIIEDNITIDDRPIVDLDAFRYVEARQAPKTKRDEGVRASIDDTPIIAPDAFRYLERKAEAAKLKKGQDTGPAIDETPQVDLTAFLYLERKGIPKKPEEGPNIDVSAIVNPEAFKYLERKPIKKIEDTGPLIDESPMVNPNAFRYLERQIAPQPRDTGPTIDTTAIINPEVFKYLERPSEIPRPDEGPTIDTRPIVPQEAFRWLDRPKQVERKPEGPSIDESPYVNPQAFRYIEAKPKPKIIDEGPSIDVSSYVNPQAFKYLEVAPSKKPIDQGPTIDTSTYVNSDLFAQFELKPKPQTPYEEQEIKRIPRIVQPLRSTQALEGKPIALVAIVDGFPIPELKWLKDGAELPASNRVTTNYDIPSKTAWIRIDSTRPDDNAVYTLLAHNPAGDVRSDARLNIVPSIQPIDNTAFVPAEAFEKIERATAPNRRHIPETTGVDDTAFVNPDLFSQFEIPLKKPRSENFSEEVVIQIPAKILAPLKSIQAPENVTVVLEAIVEGSPIPTFTWLKDQLPLSESNRFITNYDLPSKRVTLTIKDVRENDTGLYTLLASNGPQLQHSSATLQILGAPSVDQSSFISMDVFKQLEQPQNQQRQIPVQSGVDQTSYILQPDRFAVFDQIQPNRRLLNDFGGVDETPLVSMEKIRLLEIPSKIVKQPDIDEKAEAPTVLAPLQPIDAEEGSPVVLTAKISGTPMPNFTWFKDNKPLVASSRFTTYYDIPSKLIVLQINDARPDDTGVYTVRADNKSGDVETSATLNISSLPSVRDQSFIPVDKFRLLEQPNQPRSIEEISGVDERPLVDLTKLRQLEIKPSQIPEEEQIEQIKPTILIPLRNVQAIENQPVVLSAQIEGKPQPQFIWFKNDQPLSEGNRFRTHYDIPSKTIFLTIAGAREDDSGVYRLVAQNPLGQEDTSCNVTVDINQPNIDQRSFVPQTAFDKLEKPLLKLNNVISGVDQSSFFNQDLFRPFDERHIQHPSAIVGGEDSDATMPISAPKILTPLRPIKTTEGETVVLITQVEGYPLPQFTWVHNNKPIMASNRITPHHDMLTKRCFLQILDSRPHDAGTYELIAENPAGYDRTKTELTIVPVSKVDQTGYVPFDKFSTLEFKPRIPSDLRSGVDATPFVSGEIFRLLEAKPVNEQFIPLDEQNVPLEILVPLKPAVAQEGQPVILTTKIRGRPTPQFTWLRNNQPLLESNRLQTHYDFPSETLVLEISDIWPHDEGTYTVIAEKPKTGEKAQTSAPLTVRGDSTLIDRTAFVAPDAFRSLESTPTLRTALVESGVDTNSFLTPNVLRTLDQVKPKPIDVEEKEQPRTAPKVIVPLQPIKCNEGQPINFTAKIIGNPTPTFTWFKNDQPLQESNRFWSHYDIPSKTVLLQINGARPDDTGKYVLVAKNPLGQDQTDTTVNVSFGPGIDTNAFVPPEKFAAFDIPYGPKIPTQSGVDVSPFVQPERFAQLELQAPIPTKEDMEQMEAPKVTIPLQSVQVNEGSPVLLQATIIGKPRPNFVWLKDGTPLLASNRLRTRYDIGTKQVLLQINDARPQDIGEYVVIATNPAGKDSTTGSLSVKPDKPGVDERAFIPTDKFRNLEGPERRPLAIVPGVDIQPFVSPDKFRKLNEIPTSTKPEQEVPEEKRPPKVLVPLTDSGLEELMPAIFTTKIDAGVPMASFTWFKNGQPLLEGNRFTTKYDILTKTLTLQVLATRPDDQGVYTVQARNPSGSDETSCNLNIQQTPSIDTRPFVPSERFAPLEVKAPLPKNEDLQEMQPPKVIVPLQNEQVTEGAPVLLEATIVGKPTPTFTWFKDGAPLAASNRLRTRYDIGTKQVLLQINDVRPQDAGQYLVVAANPAGDVSTTGTLSVQPDKPGVDDRAFIPTDKFRNLEHPEGPERRPLAIVPGVDIQPFVSPDKFRKLNEIPTSTKPEQEVPEEKRPPKVLVPLTDSTLEELMPAIFTTKIDAGVPMASFTWFKNGQPLLEGNRYVTKYDILTKILTLQVLATRPDDQGVYTVQARNPSGSDETSCNLNIQQTPSIDTRPFVSPEHFSPLEVKAPLPKNEDLQEMQPPKVIVPLQNEQVKEGAPVLLQATIVGKPTPTFTWFKDGAPLAASNRLRTRYDIGTKQVLLQINDVRPQDAGQYLVVATNPAGKDSTTGSLSVKPDKPGVDDRAFLPEDKFRSLERPEGQAKRPLEVIPNASDQPFAPPDKLRKLNEVPQPEEKRPPRVIVPLSDSVIEESMPVILKSTIDAGQPMATFTWSKNGQPLLDNNRYTTEYDVPTKVLTLQILDARPEDQGTYTVRAKNPSGTDETASKLTVKPVPSTKKGPSAQPEQFGPLEVKAPVPKKEDLQEMQPPKVIVPLENEKVKKGSPVLLKATIVGKPTPNFTWFKDGAPLIGSKRLRTRYDAPTKQVLLQIDEVRPEDVGQYLVVATNPAGEDSTVGSVGLLPDKPGVEDQATIPPGKLRNLKNPQGPGKQPLQIVPGAPGQPVLSPEQLRKLKPVPSETQPEEEVPEAVRPPKVIVPLVDTVIEELLPIILTTTIDAGVPMASFTWTKNGQPLLEGNRYTTEYDMFTRVLTLQITGGRPDDQGTYTVRATNPVGSDETTCKLTVKPEAPTKKGPAGQPEQFGPLEIKAPPPKKEDLEQMQPPKVIVPLEHEKVKKGSPVLLKATIIGKPTPNFAWFKDRVPLIGSKRLRTRYDAPTKQVLLQIDEVQPEDVGQYLVVATNPAGEDSTVGSVGLLPDKPVEEEQAVVPPGKLRNKGSPDKQGKRPLNIVPGSSGQPLLPPEELRKLRPVPSGTQPEEEVPEALRPPKVIVPLADTVIEELMPILLTTTIDAGVTMASFTWTKNGQPLLEGHRYTTEYDMFTRVFTLQITGGRPDDQGTYTVRATNPVGSDETTGKLTIKPEAPTKKGPAGQPEQFGPLEIKAPPPKKEDLEQMQPPKVIVPLEHEKVKKGSPVLLKATIIGKPTPNFAWFKDGAPLIGSKRLRTRYDAPTKQVLLQIDEVQPEDVGQYLVVATNPAGEDSTVGSVALLPDKPVEEEQAVVPPGKLRNKGSPNKQDKRPIKIVPGSPGQPVPTPEELRKLRPVPPSTRPEEAQVPEAMRPPKVIVPLSDCVLEELMPVLLTATIDAGVPMASFTWFKNGQPLLEGNRYSTKYDIPNRVIRLQILASRPEDQGVYTVRARNPVGSDETSCKLTIRPVASVDTRPFIDAERFRPLESRPETAGNLDNDNQPLRPPKVLVPMNNVRLTEFQPIVLKSIIDAGYPMGKFTWLKDGRPLPESNRYHANFDINTRTASLFIDAARPTTDTGRYTVHVENIVGKDQTTGEVHVEGTPAIDERPFIEPSKFGKFEGPRGPILQPDLSRDRENLAPWIRLLKELQDQLIDEAKAAQLVCVVDAHPPATINWFKDGQPLIVSQRFIPDYDYKTGNVRLTIYPVYAADSGQYTMVARNIAGEVSTKCTLRIQPTANVEENPLVKFAGLRKTPQHPPGLGSEPGHKPMDLDDGLKPYFIKIPVDQEVPEGQLVRLDYIPAGRPEPTLAWYRNGIPIKPDDADHRDVVNEGGVHSLLIRNPQLGPTVEYTCVAKNKFGEAPFTVHLSVVERGSNIAPFFIEQLYNIIIIEGQDARLDACAQGFPEPKVSWEKEGKPLTPNKEYKVEFEGAKTTLYIRGAKMTDAGWYQCTATSPAGTCVTKCKVTVIPLSEAGQYPKESPQFGPQILAKLPSLPEEDTRSKYMTVPVKPPEVRPEELYKLPKRPKKSDDPLEEVKRRGIKVLPDEVLAALQKNLEEYPEEEMYSKDRPQPPKFKVHIKSQLNLNEDDPCQFEAKLIPVRDPMMRVQWFKNGKILHHASRIIPRYDFADVSLEFLYTFAEDDGIYECVATNPYGEDRTRTELKCRPKRSIIYNTQLPEGMAGVSKLQMLEDEMRYTASMIGLEEKVQEKEPKIPEFIMPLEDISVDEGDNAKFIAKVDGHPRPRITWSINGSDIANGSRYKLVFDGLVHSLDIPKTRQYDAGVVRCVAKNSLGQSESVATLNLKFRQDYRSALSKTPGGVETGLDDSFDVDIEERLRLRTQARQRESVDERARRPSTDRSIHPLHGKASDRMAWRQTVEKAGDAPNFTKPLLPLKAKEGSRVVVSVEFTGEPAPTVSWYRDGFMVEDSEDFKIHTTPTQSILTIKHAFIIDSGLYTVKLFNPIGIRQCQAAIRIMPIIAEDQTPRFLDVPQDTEILAGDPVRCQCRVEGEPFPTVAFYREDEPVNLQDKRFRVIQEGDVFTLLLFEALPADSGQYEAVAENSAGKANTRFTLIVTPRAPGGKKASIIDDPKLIHKVPYLEKPLEDLHVKEGQSATFECIIPASFGSDVKWYKGTSEWQIKPSKFFKPKSDGTKHQLFILEAYAEDEGLYKCVVSNPVGTTATTATLKVDHAMQVPEFVVGFSNLTTYEGEQVRFEVEVRGDPPPIISWNRDGEIIRDSPDFQIFTQANRSLLFIAEVFMEDQGLFTCTASNSAGSSDCSARLIVEPRPQL